MSVNIKVQSGTSVRLPTSGKYCDSDIIVTTVSGDGGIANIYDPEANPVEQGSISSASGNNVGGANRLRTNGFIKVKPNVLYRLSTNIDRFYLIQYGSDKKTVVTTGGWYTSGTLVTMHADCEYLRLTMSNATNTNITPDDFEWLTITQFDNGVDHTTEDGIIERTISGDYVNDRITAVADYAFIGGYRITSLFLPLAERIGSYSFQSCSGLLTVDLPNCTRLNSNSFSYCGQLTTFILRRTDTVCELVSTGAFTNNGIARGIGFVYVPDNLVEQYKAATNWSTYASQIKPLSELKD